MSLYSVWTQAKPLLEKRGVWIFAGAGFFFLVALGCTGTPERRPGSPDIGLPGTGTGAGGGGGTIGGTGGSFGNIQPGGTRDASDCGSKLPITFRDFTEMHPDFEMASRGRRAATLLSATLGADRKPVFQSSTGVPSSRARRSTATTG
jgi:hypothetical protein